MKEYPIDDLLGPTTLARRKTTSKTKQQEQHRAYGSSTASHPHTTLNKDHTRHVYPLEVEAEHTALAQCKATNVEWEVNGGGASLEQHAALLAGGRGGLQRGENGLVKDVLQALLREGRALDVLDRPQLCRQLIASVGGDGLLLELGHLRRVGDERLTSEMAVVCGHFC
jgi:hypothetical protein